MRNTYSGEYPQDFAAISLAVREAAGWRCIRCWHPFAPDTGSPLFCDSACDTHRGIHRRALHDDDRQSQHIGPRVTRITAENRQWLGSLNYGVHHFDGDKANNRWWNLMAMCNSCHLKVQSSVIPERAWLFEHSEWARVYVGGFYAWWFARREPTREEVQADASLFLAIGQPWLFPDRADQARAYITHGFLRATDPQILPFDDRHRDIVSMNSYEP
jgi:hypothetical protein